MEYPIPKHGLDQMNAKTTYTADGQTSSFVLGWGYLDQANVQVATDTTGTGNSYVTQTNGTDYDFDPNGLSIDFAEVPAKGTLIQFTRISPRELIKSFSDGKPITAEDLDAAVRQAIYLVNEFEDKTTGA